MEKPTNVYEQPTDRDYGGGIARGNRGTAWRGAKGENWGNCNSIINKIYF